MYMSCVPYVLCAFPSIWLTDLDLYVLFELTCFCSNLLDGLDVAMTFAMVLRLKCKSKTWGQYCGGCISKLLCICLVYHMCCIG